MRIGIIGAGKVGVSLGLYLAKKMTIIGLYDVNQTAAQNGASLIKTDCFSNLETLVETSDLLFLTVTDDAIKPVWEQILAFNMAGKIICHCSGALTSEVFVGIEERGAYGYSVHPAMTISHHSAVAEIAVAPIVIEGGEERLDEVASLFRTMGNTIHLLRAEHKVRYHAAAVFASNFIVALAQISTELLAECGFDEDGQQIFLPLMQASTHNIVKNGLVNALTGPVERGDLATIEKHLTDLSGDNLELYRLLSEKITKVASTKNPERNYADLTEVLSKK